MFPYFDYGPYWWEVNFDLIYSVLFCFSDISGMMTEANRTFSCIWTGSTT